jgi:hypothetical protein
VNLVPAIAVGRMHDERLQDAALSDVLSEFGNRLLGELGARVVRILVEHRHGQQQWPAIVATALDDGA